MQLLKFIGIIALSAAIGVVVAASVMQFFPDINAGIAAGVPAGAIAALLLKHQLKA